MGGTAGDVTPVNAKAVLIDASTMTVLWMNEAAEHDLEGTVADSAVGMPVERAVPLAVTLGVPDALRAVAQSGVPQHLSTGLVSTRKGTMKIVASVYHLPQGTLLLLMENAWQPVRDTVRGEGRRHDPSGAR